MRGGCGQNPGHLNDVIYGIYSPTNYCSIKTLYDKIKKVVPTVRQLGYPAAHTLYEWINQRKATNGKFPNLMPSGVKSINLKVKMDHDGYSAERKFQILKRCFEGTENIRDVAIEEGISRNIIYIWRKKYLKY